MVYFFRVFKNCFKFVIIILYRLLLKAYPMGYHRRVCDKCCDATVLL